MAVVTATALGIGALAVSAIGAGLTYYSSTQSAASQDRIAQYNFEQQKRNAELTRSVAQRQSETQKKMLEARTLVSTQNAKEQSKNALLQAQEQIRRTRAQKEALLSRQRAAYASAGVVLEGTPLEVMADTAGLFEMQAADELYKANLESAAAGKQGELDRLGAGFSASLLKVEDYAAKVGVQQANRQSQIDLFAGQSAAAGTRLAGTGTLLSNSGSMAYTASQMDWSKKSESA